jgi:hypothetical protein
MGKRKQVTEKFMLRCGHEGLHTYSGSNRKTMEQFLSHSGPVCSACQLAQAIKEREGSDPSSSRK